MNGVGVERQSSIEKEPRTLNNNQIEYAREIALYVVNTRSNEEALTIFTQGLEPVVRCGEDEMMGNINAEAAEGYGSINVDCDHNNDNNYIRDIVSAPF